MIMRISGSVSVVTGAAQGIGKAISEVLLARGGRVALLDVDYRRGWDTLEYFHEKYGKEKVVFIPCDVTSPALLRQAFTIAKERWNRLDIVINNAGIGDEDRWEDMIEINLKSVIHGTKLAFEVMSRDGGDTAGVVVNVSSMAGVMPIPSGAVYTATKHGVVGFTRALGSGLEYARSGIRVNALCPSFVDTPLVRNVPAAQWDQLTRATGVSSLLNANDVARECVEKLIEDDGNNGQALAITVRRGSEFVPLPLPVPAPPCNQANE